MLVYILLINARTENEGIHTIQMRGVDKVLMFHEEDDATRYALMLEAQDFPDATVEGFDSEEIEEFCRSAGYEWEVIAKGQLAIPPESNVEETDWNPEGKAEEKKSAPDSPSEISNSELDAIRKRLEGLL